MTCVGVVFNDEALLSVGGGQSVSLQQSGLFEDIYRIPLANNSIGCVPVLVTREMHALFFKVCDW